MEQINQVVEVSDAVQGTETEIQSSEQVDIFGGSESVFEIEPGMTVEQVMAEFFDSDALQEQPEPVYRLDSSGHRYYYIFDEDGEPRFFTSVTTMIKQTMPTSPQLVKWIADTGYEESQKIAADRAAYGTFMHIQIGELLVARKYDLDTVKERMRAYIANKDLDHNFMDYADDIKKDILSFAQFMKDYELKPLAIEIVLTHPTDGYAGAIDLVCEMTIEEKGFFGETYKTGDKKGMPKESKRKRRIRAIVDFKSGRKGFYDEYEIQLMAYKSMWDIHFPDYPVEKLYNWSPKEWRGTTATYNLKDQTDGKNAEKLQYLVQLARIEDEKRDNTVIKCSGMIDLDKDTSNIQELNLDEVVRQYNPNPIQRKEPEEENTK